MIVERTTAAAGELGILPAVLVLAWGAIGGYLAKTANDRMLDYSNWEGAVQPASAPPAPAAPQTAAEMRTWTPADMTAATTTARAEWAKEAIPETPRPAGAATSDPLLWAALGLGAVSLFLIAKG